MGERERVAALSHPVARGGVGERSAPRPFRRKPNPSPERPHQLRRKPKSPPDQPHERVLRFARNQIPRRNTRTCPVRNRNSHQHSPTGERERVAALSLPVARGDVGERSAPRPFRQKPNPPSEQSNPHRRKPKSPPAQPRESARGSHLAPRCPRGCRGAERPTLVSSETKSSIRTVKPAPSKTQIPASTAPWESARGSQPSRTPSPEGV